MGTVTVSGRVDEGTKRLADMYIRKQGLTPADVIASVWNHIADTGEVPFAVQKKKNALHMLQKFEKLRASTPTGTPLSSMSIADLKEELSNRD